MFSRQLFYPRQISYDSANDGALFALGRALQPFSIPSIPTDAVGVA